MPVSRVGDKKNEVLRIQKRYLVKNFTTRNGSGVVSRALSSISVAERIKWVTGTIFAANSTTKHMCRTYILKSEETKGEWASSPGALLLYPPS